MKLHDWKKVSTRNENRADTEKTECRVCGLFIWRLKKFSAEDWVSIYHPHEEDCDAVVARQILEE